MKKIMMMIGLLQSFTVLQAQVSAGPYVVKKSAIFTSPKGLKVLNPLGYGANGIIQVNGDDDAKSFNFQKFSSDLTLQKENTVLTKGKIAENNHFERFVITKNKTYLLTREVKKEAKTEGMTALEFYPDKLDFSDKSVSLFQSTDKVKYNQTPGVADAEMPEFGMRRIRMYDFILSADKTKFLCQYQLVAHEKNDKINKDIVGLYVYDENLNKIWGGEYKMPYTEAIMDNCGYTVSDDGKAYLLAKVFDNDERKAKTKDGVAGYHFEIFVYDKDQKGGKPIVINLDSYFSQDAFVYEDINHNILISGFYSRKPGGTNEGVYMVKLDVATSTISKVNGGFYEIPSELIRAFSSAKEQKKLDKQEKKDGDIGVRYLRIRNVITTPNGSTKVVAEEYEQTIATSGMIRISSSSNGLSLPPNTVGVAVTAAATRSSIRYYTGARDIYIFSIDSGGKLEWTKKIPKTQTGGNWLAASLSFNTLVKGNDLHLFFLDNIKNMNLPENQKPKIHLDGAGGFLNGVTVDAKGTVTKFNLGDTREYKTNFFIRFFVKNRNDELISTMRKKKKNLLMSIEVK